jgi:hypothetical protein
VAKEIYSVAEAQDMEMNFIYKAPEFEETVYELPSLRLQRNGGMGFYAG